ncbi:MAG: GNAT family N-acetyltransferase [Defluviitaleaceae bacterium]|nr:GNAT family N-acetyltransferase [Defluviitaleaceae bacterium]MCL2262331.1 GNAT family N-acetyltransferase [Defluviitaleaceae bacterium]
MLTLKWFMGEKEDLSEVHAIRREVFVEEQACPEEEEFDGTDGSCVHLLIYDNDIPVCTGRVFISEEYFKIGRVATVMTHRGRGIATGLMQSLINACVAMGGTRQIIHAQTTAKGFYETLGFTAYGEEFDEAGIRHIAMEHFGGAKKCGDGGHCGGCAKGE